MKEPQQQAFRNSGGRVSNDSASDTIISPQAASTPDPYSSMMHEIQKISSQQTWDQIKSFYNIA